MRKTATFVCWLLLAALAGLFLAATTPLGRGLGIHADLRNFAVTLGILGVALVVLTLTANLDRWLRLFMITAGGAAAGWPVSLWLQDLLFSRFPGEGITFVLVFFILPAAFLIGVAGAVITGIKQAVTSR